MPRFTQFVGILVLASFLAFAVLPVSAEALVARPGVIDHVTYLASPELKGRKPMSRGSKKARTYIADHFASIGLVPWGVAEAFEQSVIMGTNVVGVLPGSDPALKDQIVLVTAHYDHLGKKHLGAADNAAGTAALLDLATRFANSPQRPGRSIAFAAFDSEERGLWGAVSFSVREDFDEEKIAVNINLDVLGRKGFGVIENSIFLAQSHTLPPLKAVLASSAMTVLPMSSLVSAMRGDHAVFEGLGVPVLFFSSGPFPDYHRESDTLQNLDFGLLAGAADAVESVIATVANTPAFGAEPIPLAGDDVTLASVAKVLKAILANEESLPMDAEAREICARLQKDLAAHLAGESCDAAVHADLFATYLLALGPLIAEYETAHLDEKTKSAIDDKGKEDADKAGEGDGLTAMLVLFALHDDIVIDGYRQVAAKVAARSKSELVFCGVPAHNGESVPLRDEEFAVTSTESGVLVLNALVPVFEFELRPQRLLRFLPAGSFTASSHMLRAQGTEGELADYLLIGWQRRWYGENGGEAFAKLLRAVTGEDIEPDLQAWLSWRIAQLGVSSELEWQRHVGETKNYDLQLQTLGDPYAYYEDVPTAALRIASDPGAPVHLRDRALGWIVHLDLDKGTISAKPEMLAQLIPFIDDTTVIAQPSALFDWDALPIVGPVMRKTVGRAWVNPKSQPEEKPTISKSVHGRLQKLTGATDVQQSREAWDAWLNEKLSADPEGNFLPALHEINGFVEFRLRKGRPMLMIGGKEKSLPEIADPAAL